MGIIGGTIKGSVIQKSQYELNKEKNCPLRDYIREIVKEEIAAQNERLGNHKTEKPYYGVEFREDASS